MNTRSSARSPAPDSDDRMEVLQNTIKAMQAQINELNAARVAPAPAPVPVPAFAPPAASTHAPKVRDPEFFNGGPDSNLPRFLAQVRLVFRDNPTHFLRDEKKVNYAISHFRGAASSWIEPFLGMTELPAWMSDFALFEAELRKVFHHADQLLKVVHDLLHLKQTGSVRSYAIEFHRLASRLQWPNQPLAGIFYYGLKTSIRVELIKHQDILERKLEDVIALANNSEDILCQQDQERSGKRPNRPARKDGSSNEPSDASRVAADHSGSQSAKSNGNRPRRLTEEEKKYRRENNLCAYCGAKEHAHLDCPKRSRSHPRPAGTPVSNDQSSGKDLAQTK
jgi:hypothetical protein